MSIAPGWVSVRDAALSDVDKWMRSQPSAKEAMCGV